MSFIYSRIWHLSISRLARCSISRLIWQKIMFRPRTITLRCWLLSVVRVGRSMVSPKTGIRSTWAGDAFGRQRGAMALEGGWLIPYLKSTYPDVDYDIAPLPINPATNKRADLLYTNSWGAFSGSKHPEAAWQLIKYMTGQQ